MYEIGLEEGMWLIAGETEGPEHQAHGVDAASRKVSAVVRGWPNRQWASDSGVLTASRRLLFLGNSYSK